MVYYTISGLVVDISHTCRNPTTRTPVHDHDRHEQDASRASRIPAQYWNSEASRALSLSGDIDDDEPTLPQAGAGEEAG